MTESSARKLTPKEERFCQEYLIDLNQTQAAIRAGYSARSAHATAYEVLTKPYIQARIQELQLERQRRTERTADEVINKLWEVADFTIDEIGEFDGREMIFKPSEEWSKIAKTSVRTIEQKTTTRENQRTGEVITDHYIKFKVEPLSPALDALRKQYGLDSDFNTAIATFRRYGLNVKADENGRYSIEDEYGNSHAPTDQS